MLGAQQLLVLLLLATLVSEGFTCSDIRIFVAPCTFSHFGTPISKEVAQARVSQVLTDKGLARLSFGTGFHSLPLLLFNNPFFEDVCEIPINASCNVLKCLDCQDVFGRRKLLQCLPYFGCFVSAAPPNPGAGCIKFDVITTSVVVCIGNDCTAFTGEYADVAIARNNQCGKPTKEEPGCTRTEEICAKGLVDPTPTGGSNPFPPLDFPIPDLTIPSLDGPTQQRRQQSRRLSPEDRAAGLSTGQSPVPICTSDVQAQCCSSSGVRICKCDQCPESSYLRTEKDGIITLLATGSLSFSVCACP